MQIHKKISNITRLLLRLRFYANAKKSKNGAISVQFGSNKFKKTSVDQVLYLTKMFTPTHISSHLQYKYIMRF